MRRMFITAFSIVAMAAPFGCGSSGDTDTATGGNGGSVGGKAGTSAKGGADGGGSGGAGTGATAGSPSGGSAGNASGGFGGVSLDSGLDTGIDSGLNGIDPACTTCATAHCAAQVAACLANNECSSCANADYTAAACKSNAEYKAVCLCAAGATGQCSNDCTKYCAGVN